MSFSVFLLSVHNWQTSVSAKLLQRKPSMLKIVLPAQILKFAESAQEFWKAYISWTLNFSSLVQLAGDKGHAILPGALRLQYWIREKYKISVYLENFSVWLVHIWVIWQTWGLGPYYSTWYGRYANSISNYQCFFF